MANKNLVVYLLRFLLSFCILYFGTKVIIGLSAPGGYYSNFVHSYLNYISLLRFSLLHGSNSFVTIAGYKSYIANTYSIRILNGRGVNIVYSCLGYGIMSFWAAFVFAYKAGWEKKILWILIGWILIWCINVTRISLLLIAVNNNKSLPFNLNHHTLFNIAAYTTIFILIYFFDRSQKDRAL